jgi:hypothetical protein
LTLTLAADKSKPSALARPGDEAVSRRRAPSSRGAATAAVVQAFDAGRHRRETTAPDESSRFALDAKRCADVTPFERRG